MATVKQLQFRLRNAKKTLKKLTTNLSATKVRIKKLESLLIKGKATEKAAKAKKKKVVTRKRPVAKKKKATKKAPAKRKKVVRKKNRFLFISQTCLELGRKVSSGLSISPKRLYFIRCLF